MNIEYIIAKIMSKIRRNHQVMIQYYRRKGIQIGENCLICSNIVTKEPRLISIGSNVTISTNVTFVTHDNCIKLIFPEKSDLFGCIRIGNNCFIGENSTILYGCNIGDNVIVAAGSVVANSFNKKNIVIGGNPARIIGSWQQLADKYETKAVLRSDVELVDDSNNSFLIRRREKEENINEKQC